MSQHDLNIANDVAAAVRADLNGALQALGTQQSGASAPATTYAYMWWADTTAGLLKQRNAANSGWIIRANLAETRVLTKSSAYTVVLVDFDLTILCTGTFSLAFAAAATLGDGFRVSVRNIGTGVITLDPNASEQINGATSISLISGDACDVHCNGSALQTIGLTNARAEEGAYTPVDSSGQGLVLSGAIGQYRKVGGQCSVVGEFTYPPTLSTLGAAIAGFPFTIAQDTPCMLIDNSGLANSAILLAGAAEIQILQYGTFTRRQNVELSGKKLIFFVSFPTA